MDGKNRRYVSYLPFLYYTHVSIVKKKMQIYLSDNQKLATNWNTFEHNIYIYSTYIQNPDIQRILYVKAKFRNLVILQIGWAIIVTFDIPA